MVSTASISLQLVVRSFNHRIFKYFSTGTSLRPTTVPPLAQAIKDEWLYVMFYDDLPMLARVGQIDEETGHEMLYTHILFEMKYNADQVVEAKLNTPATSLIDVSE